MSTLRRVVFDTSTLVGAALKPFSVPHRALLQALARCDVCASAQTLLELQQVMQRDKFDRYLSRETRLDFVTMLHQNMHFFAVMPADEEGVQPSCRDPKDNKFLALAQACHADALVSSDDDLLVLNPWRGVLVLSPATFLPLVTG
ncbi:MAG: putative toxin-antitoxin system toxin component, PIN family [Polaromonas sp.]